MARKKSRKRKRSPIVSIISMLMVAFTGGGVGGYMNPDWPVVGRLMQVFRATEVEEGPSEGEGFEKLRQVSTLIRDRVDGHGDNAVDSETPTSIQLATHQRPNGKLLVATFNIQVFGASKLSKPKVVDVLAQVVRQFDVVAIQEVRAKQDDILPRFVAAINADGSRYEFLIGPRLGRSNSKEQYAFVYDTTRVEHDPTAVGTMSDPNDALHREPFVARFRAVTDRPSTAFSFWLVNIHTDPDEVPEEVTALADVFRIMQSARADEDDVILLGDLNADETQMGPLGEIPGIGWVVSGVTTNTRQNKAYDNVIFHRQATTEYTGRWGVFDLEQSFGLSRNEALKVSDHLPVWAEFDSREASSNVAARPRLPGR